MKDSFTCLKVMATESNKMKIYLENHLHSKTFEDSDYILKFTWDIFEKLNSLMCLVNQWD